MKMVQIKDALYNNKPFTGDFELVDIRKGDQACKREVYLIIKNGEREMKVHANKADYLVMETTELNDAVCAMTPAQAALDANIKKRFSIFDRLIEFVIKGAVRSLIVSGAAGIGKSYNLETRLNKAIDHEEINSFTILKGKISAIALFAQLFLHKNKGDVLVLDDIDVIFQDETSLNLLKGALDTGDTRRLSWLTASTWLEEQGIDQEFEFEGSCVFVTNLDFDRMIDRGSTLAPHFRALMSRSIYLDLGIHTNLEIMTRIKQVVNETSMLDVHGIDNYKKIQMLTWMDDNYENLRELSLRTILKLASFMKGDPDGWQDIAEATMIKNLQFGLPVLPTEVAELLTSN